MDFPTFDWCGLMKDLSIAQAVTSDSLAVRKAGLRAMRARQAEHDAAEADAAVLVARRVNEIGLLEADHD